MVEIWRITVLEDDDFLSATQNFVGLYTRKLNIHFAPSNFSFVFWELENELTVVFFGEAACGSVLLRAKN